MRILFLLPLLLVFLIPAYAYNSGYQPVYQPSLPPSSGGINNTISSIGVGESVVSGQVLNDHQLKGLAVSGDLTIGSNDTDVIISFTAPPSSGEANTASNVGVGHGLFKQKTGVNLEFLNIFCAGDLICSANSTDVKISHTAGGSSALNDLTDVIITSPAYLSTLFYDGANWIDKVFSVNTKSPVNGVFITGINNQTGAITTQSFKANTKTCSGTDKISAFNNSTGEYTCSADQTGSGGGITTLGADVTCTATATYCDVFTIPLTASSGNRINVNLIGDSDTAGGAIQMRVQFDNAGNTGFCTYRTYTTATAEVLDVLAATTTTDTGETVWLAGANVPMPLDIHCGFETDASPGNALVQVQAEVASTITIQKGSNYIKTP